MRDDVLVVEGSDEALLDWSMEHGAGDGLPILAPTPERVERMVAAGPYPPDKVLGVLAPRWAPATVRKVAANAVMAGCRPDYFPVVLAAVEAMADPALDLEGISSSTGPHALMVMISGPICRRIGVNCGYGCMGPGWRANATIGRAVSLIQHNVAGCVPGQVSMSSHAQPGRYTFCFGENEEETPWPPYRSEMRLGERESCVTVAGVVSRLSLMQRGVPGESPETLLGYYGLAAPSVLLEVIGGGPRGLVFVLGPNHAARLAHAGWTRDRIRHYLFAQVNGLPEERLPPLLRADAARWGLVRDGCVTLVSRPDDIRIWVSGGPGGHHSVLLCTRRWPVTRVVVEQGGP
jgi:hypothetical protein